MEPLGPGLASPEYPSIKQQGLVQAPRCAVKKIFPLLLDARLCSADSKASETDRRELTHIQMQTDAMNGLAQSGFRKLASLSSLIYFGTCRKKKRWHGKQHKADKVGSETESALNYITHKRWRNALKPIKR